MRTIFQLLGCIALCVLMTACRHKIEVFSANNISGGDLRAPSQELFAHVNERHYLTINHKTYRDVAGGPPYYLEVPELHSVLFVTGTEDKGDVRFHIVNPNTGHETVINGGQIHFGTDIKAPRNSGEAYTDFVLSATFGEITLASQGPNARLIIVLNMHANKVERVEREMIPAK